MAKKRRSATPRKTRGFDPETTRWFAPVVFVFLLLAMVVLFSDFIFSDQMLRGSDTLQAGYPARAFLVDYVRTHGAVPQWIPYYFGGMPYVEAFHGDIFYPFSVLKFFGPLHRMLGWILLMHIFASGVFMYFAARQFRLSKVASLLSAACYMFAGYLVSMVAPGHDGKIFVTSLFPLVLLFLDRGFEKKPFLNFSLLGLVVGLIIVSPHPQMSYFMLWSVSLYAAFKLIILWRERRSVVPLIRPAVLTTYAVVIGLLLSSIQFWPGYHYTTNFSPRADAKRGWDWATSWSMHEEEAMSVLIPEFSGTSTQKAETYYWGKNYFKDNQETVGAVPFFLALLGFLFYRRKESYFFGGLALFALLYALGGTTPIFRLFYGLIPKVSSLRAPSMIMFLFSFSVAMLAGMGVQSVMDAVKDRKTVSDRSFTYVLFGFPAFIGLLAVLFSVNGKGMLKVWSWLFYSEASSTMVQRGLSKLDVAYLNLPAIQSGAWLAFLFTGLAALCLWLYRSGKMRVGILVGMLIIPVVDGVRFDSRFIDLVSEAEFSARFGSNRLAHSLGNLDEKFRVLDLAKPNDNTMPFHGIDAVVGYHGNQLRWYDALLGGPSLTNVRSLNARFLNLAGLKYITNPTGRDVPADHFGEKPLVTVAESGSTKLLRNDNAYPRVFVVDTYRVIPEQTDIVNEVLRGREDMRRLVYLEEEPSLVILPDSNSSDSAWIIDYEIDSVLVGLNVAHNKILVMTDNYYDAWHAYVDGTPARLLRAYGSFRAVEIPAGSRQVLFKYYSERYVIARLVTWLTAGYLLVIIGLSMFWSRSKRQDSGLSQEKEKQP